MADIREVLQNLDIPCVGAEHRHGRIGWVQLDCPLCGEGTERFHMGISISTGACACWQCGRQNTAKMLSLACDQSAFQIRQILDDAVLVRAPERVVGRLKLPDGRGELLPGHRAYLVARGYNVAQTEAWWGIQGIGNDARERHMRWRIFIPIHHHGQIVSWTTRSIRPNDSRRYMSAAISDEKIRHKEILYGADYAEHSIIIHEGPLDVWATGPGAVATCGIAYTEKQLLAMSRYPVRVVCYDAEPNAQVRARVLADALSVFPGTTLNVTLETGKDASDADPAEIAELRERFLE